MTQPRPGAAPLAIRQAEPTSEAHEGIKFTADCTANNAVCHAGPIWQRLARTTGLWRVSSDFLIPRRSDQGMLWISRRFQSSV